MTEIPLAYVDTNILISYALGEKKDKRFHIAKKVFEDALHGKYKIVISNFVLSEALHALRNIVTAKIFREIKSMLTQSELIKMVNSPDFREKVNQTSLEAFKTIIEYITSDPKHFRVERPETIYSEKIFLKGLEILSANLGEFRVYRYSCPKCGSYMKCEKCKFYCEVVYKSINAPDVTHVLISENIKCRYFFTMDKYFSNIPKEEVQVEIKVLS